MDVYGKVIKVSKVMKVGNNDEIKVESWMTEKSFGTTPVPLFLGSLPVIVKV